MWSCVLLYPVYIQNHGSLWVLRLLQPLKLVAMIQLKYCLKWRSAKIKSNQFNATYCLFICFAININVLIQYYTLIRTQLSNLVKLFKLLRFLCLCSEYLCIHHYVQIQVQLENTKEVIRNINRIRTDNTMAKEQKPNRTMIFTHTTKD